MRRQDCTAGLELSTIRFAAAPACFMKGFCQPRKAAASGTPRTLRAQAGTRLTITDDYPLAQAFVIVSAIPAGI